MSKKIETLLICAAVALGLWTPQAEALDKINVSAI